ncbi:MAG: YceI family protein [Phycisphaerae bacterium]|nr:YceI family protein [Phycisphaerae bacterium]
MTVTGLAFTTNANNAEPENYKIDNSHSSVHFRIKHLGVSYCYGRFNEIDGRLTMSGDDKNALEITIKADSIDSNDKKRDDHLRGPDFFNVKQFPVISFKSSEFKKSGTDQFKVTGDLTMHGVTKSVTVTLDHIGSGKDPWGGQRTGFEGTFEVKRSDFGISYMPGGLGEDVRIIVALEAIKQ